MRVQFIIDEHDGDLLPPQLIQCGVVFYRSLDYLDAVADLPDEIGDDRLDDRERSGAEMAPGSADDRDGRHAEGTSTG